jgi:hypothetical protein
MFKVYPLVPETKKPEVHLSLRQDSDGGVTLVAVNSKDGSVRYCGEILRITPGGCLKRCPGVYDELVKIDGNCIKLE